MASETVPNSRRELGSGAEAEIGGSKKLGPKNPPPWAAVRPSLLVPNARVEL
jgi:hypothetical protein